MRCPADATELRMTERQGVEIDYCPKCRGVWLDRGELDKIIERSSRLEESYRKRGDDDDDDDDDRRRYVDPRSGQQPGYGQPGYGAPPPYPPQHYKKRKSFWSELFD